MGEDKVHRLVYVSALQWLEPVTYVLHKDGVSQAALSLFITPMIDFAEEFLRLLRDDPELAEKVDHPLARLWALKNSMHEFFKGMFPQSEC